MKPKLKKLVSILIVFALTMAPASASGAVGAGKVARETAEYLVSKWGQGAGEGVENLTVAVNRLIREHGEEVVPLFRRHGPDAVQAASRYGREGVGLIQRFGDDGLEVLLRSGDEIVTLVRRHGDGAMEVAIKHRGVGERLVSELGDEGVRLGRKLTTEEVSSMLRLIPKLREGDNLQRFVEIVDHYGSAVFTYIARHPEVVLGGSALALLLANPEVIGTAIETVGEGIGRGIGGGIQSAGEEVLGRGFSVTRWAWAGIVCGLILIVFAGPRYLQVLLERPYRPERKKAGVTPKPRTSGWRAKE